MRTELHTDPQSPDTDSPSPATELLAADVAAELADIRERLDTVLAGLDGRAPRRVTIALDDPDEPDPRFVLTAALRDWAGDLRARVQDDPQEPNRADFLRWAETADRLYERIDEAL